MFVYNITIHEDLSLKRYKLLRTCHKHLSLKMHEAHAAVKRGWGAYGKYAVAYAFRGWALRGLLYNPNISLPFLMPFWKCWILLWCLFWNAKYSWILAVIYIIEALFLSFFVHSWPFLANIDMENRLASVLNKIFFLFMFK